MRISDDLFEGENRISNSNQVETIFHRYSISGAYRVSNQLIVQATIPFLDARFEETGIATNTISGLSDISFNATWLPPQIPGLQLNLGVITPTGEAQEQPITGIVAPSVFQLGTGAWQILLGAGYSKRVGDWAFTSQLNISLPLDTSSQGFRPAESYFLTLGAKHSITNSLNLGLALQASFTTEDEFLGLDLSNTGATTLSLRPSLVWQIHDRLSMSASIEIPIYRDVNEIGIAVGPTWRIGLSHSF